MSGSPPPTGARTLTLGRTILGTSSARGRLVAVGAGVAATVALLLLLWGAGQALQERDTRTAWLQVSGRSADPAVIASDGLPDDAALVLAGRDRYEDLVIVRRDLALPQDGAAGPRIPGLPDELTPGPGEYVASPALADVIASVPTTQLGDRYGEPIGTIPEALLADASGLVVIAGGEPDVLAQRGAVYTTDLAGTPPIGGNPAYRMALLIGGAAVIIPLLQFLAIVTGLGAATRRHQFATLRTLGASPGLIRRLIALETGAIAVLGSLVGVGLWWVLRPLAARVPMGGDAFAVSDLDVGLPVILAATTASALVAVGIAWWRVRGTDPSAVDLGRDARERRPSLLSLIPLVAGLGLLAAIAAASRPVVGATPSWVLPGLLAGFVLVCAGLLLAGPWFTHAASRALGARTGSPAAVVAAGRLHHHSRAVHRAVAGLVVALFSVSVFAGAASAVSGSVEAQEEPGLLPRDTLSATLSPVASDAEVAALVEDLSAVPGVRTVLSGGAVLLGDDLEGLSAFALSRTGLVDLGLDVEGLGEPDADVIGLTYGALELPTATPDAVTAVPIRSGEATPVDADDPLGQSVPAEHLVVVGTDGSTAAQETARTTLEAHPLLQSTPQTRAERNDLRDSDVLLGLAALANVGIGIAVVVAGVSLTVATAAAIVDRRRVLGLLRLTGMPVRTIRRIVVIESLAPLFATVGVAIGVGFLVAAAFVRGASVTRTMSWPGWEYAIVLGVGLTLVVCCVLATTRMIGRDAAGPTEQTRFE